jgi:hypothetical protein
MFIFATNENRYGKTTCVEPDGIFDTCDYRLLGKVFPNYAASSGNP